MSQTPIVKAVLDWLASCPLVSSYNGGDVAFSIEYLGAEPAQFSLEVSPSAPTIEQYISGSLRARNFVLASRMIYSQDEAQQAANSGFWEEFSDWVETQSRQGELPFLGPGKKAEKVVCLSPGYIIGQDANTCRTQMQLQLQYYQEG